MASAEQWPLEVDEYITDTAKVAHVGKMTISIAARIGLSAELLNTAYDAFVLNDVHDNVIRAVGIAAAGIAAYKTMDTIGRAVEFRARK